MKVNMFMSIAMKNHEQIIGLTKEVVASRGNETIPAEGREVMLNYYKACDALNVIGMLSHPESEMAQEIVDDFTHKEACAAAFLRSQLN